MKNTSNRYISGLMPTLIKKSWTVSIAHWIFTSSYIHDVCLDAVVVQITISGIEHSQIALGCDGSGIFFSFKVTLREVPSQVFTKLMQFQRNEKNQKIKVFI